MSPPLAAGEMVLTVGVNEGVITWPASPKKLPAKLKRLGPFPSEPEVTTYCTVMTAPFSGLRPKIPSPNKSSYLSSWTSCIRYVSDIELIPTILSTNLYCFPLMPGDPT